MIRHISLMFFVSLATTALAEERGKIVTVGHGSAEAAPEYTEVNVLVTSLCYETSTAAKEANAIVAQQLLDSLKEFTRDPRDTITASGGPNIRQTETIPMETGYKILCERKWRASNVLSIKMAAIEDLPALQDRMLLLIDQAGVLDPEKVAQTYGELSQPSFYVYPETLLVLRTEAQGKALDDAKAQLDNFAGRCGFADVRLNSVTPANQTIYIQADGMEMEAGPTPIIPDTIRVRASWQFEWTFGSAASCFL